MQLRRNQLLALQRTFYLAHMRAAVASLRCRVSADDTTNDLIVTDRMGRVSRVRFGPQGQPSTYISPERREYRFDFPSTGLRQVQDADGLIVGASYDEIERLSVAFLNNRWLWSLSYDNDGSLQAINYPDGTSRSFTYLSDGRSISVRGRLGYVQEFTFDDSGSLTGFTDGAGHRMRFEYGDWNRPERVWLPDGTVDSCSYGPDGSVSGLSWGDTSAQLKVDHEGRPCLIQYSDGTFVEFGRDTEGRILHARNELTELSFKWTDDDRPGSEVSSAGSVRYQYDGVSQLTALAYPSGDVVRFSYDDDGRVVSATDWNGGIHSFAYHPTVHGYSHIYPNGIKETSTLSSEGILARVDTWRDSHRILSTQYSVNEGYQISAITDSEFGSAQYRYDCEGQLVFAHEFNGVTETFEYDGAGNRIRSGVIPAAFDAMNGLFQTGGTTCSLDERGNTTSCPARGGLWRLHWNHQNLLASAEGPTGESVTFGYDAFRRRIWKRSRTANGQQTVSRYVWAGEQIVELSIDDGVTQRRQEFAYVPGTLVPLATRIGGRIYSYHCDHRGVPTRITDDGGIVVWAATFTAFGDAVTRRSDIDNLIRLPGQWHDTETGLHYNRFRYYSPMLGRYLTRDPIGLMGGPNLYAYADNDPINRADAFGLWWKEALSVVAGVAAAAVVIALAPVSVPALIVAAGAASVGVGVGLEVNKALNLKDPNALDIGKAFVGGFFKGAVFTAGVVVAMAALPEMAAAIAVGASGYGIYSMCAEHFGLGGNVPFSDMSAQQQNRSVGELGGSLVGGGLVGLAAKWLGLPKAGARIRARIGRSGGGKVYDLSPGDPNKPLKFGQKGVSPEFSSKGRFKGADVDTVAEDLKSGRLKPEDVPVEYMWVNGEKVVINNRSATALSKAEIPQENWTTVDKTGNLPPSPHPDNEASVLDRLDEMNGEPSDSIPIRETSDRSSPTRETVQISKKGTGS
jgi:RHS repeat-associated protein